MRDPNRSITMKTNASRLFFAVLTCVATWTLPGSAEAQTLSVEQARAIVTPFYQALNAGNDAPALINQVTSADWMSCGGNEVCRSRDQVGASIASLEKAVPDLKWEIKDVLVSGDRVIVRGEATGSPNGPFMGVPSAGRNFRIMSIDIHTISDGKLARSYHVEDWMGATRQLSSP
jgi:predicted ester cyclase